LHSLPVNRETNLLTLVAPWLDNICQIKTKVLQCQNPKKFVSKQGLNQFPKEEHNQQMTQTNYIVIQTGVLVKKRGGQARTKAKEFWVLNIK